MGNTPPRRLRVFRFELASVKQPGDETGYHVEADGLDLSKVVMHQSIVDEVEIDMPGDWRIIAFNVLPESLIYPGDGQRVFGFATLERTPRTNIFTRLKPLLSVIFDVLAMKVMRRGR